MKKFFKQLAEYGLYLSIIFLLMVTLTYLVSMLFKANLVLFATPLIIVVLFEFVLTKDFMDIKTLNISYKLTVASAILGLNTLLVGFCFNEALKGFGNVLALMLSVIAPVSVIVWLMMDKNKKLIREFLDTKI